MEEISCWGKMSSVRENSNLWQLKFSPDQENLSFKWLFYDQKRLTPFFSNQIYEFCMSKNRGLSGGQGVENPYILDAVTFVAPLKGSLGKVKH